MDGWMGLVWERLAPRKLICKQRNCKPLPPATLYTHKPSRPRKQPNNPFTQPTTPPTCIMHPNPQESTAHGGPAATSPHAMRATSAGLYCAPTIHVACCSAKSPWQAASDSRSKPCSFQSRVSVTTTAAMHMWPWILGVGCGFGLGCVGLGTFACMHA